MPVPVRNEFCCRNDNIPMKLAWLLIVEWPIGMVMSSTVITADKKIFDSTEYAEEATFPLELFRLETTLL